MPKEAMQAHLGDLIKKLRDAADQLEAAKSDDVRDMHMAAMEVQSCCGDCILVTGIPCKTCVKVSPLG